MQRDYHAPAEAPNGPRNDNQTAQAAVPAREQVSLRRGWEPAVIGVHGLQEMIDALRNEGFTVVGPTRRGEAIGLAEITRVGDLPRGCGDRQDAATYRLTQRGDKALFGFAATAQSWKSVLFPPRELLWSADRGSEGFTAKAPEHHAPPYALLGVRSCDLHAIAIHDRVLLERKFTDQAYAARRDGAFIVAVGCSDPGGTCFCASMGTGPAPSTGFDLSLTELLGQDGHRFLVTVGSDRGADLLTQLTRAPATSRDHAQASEVINGAVTRMGRRLDTDGIREVLYNNPEHPRWDDVASRCLACANCTLVCPTCFCVSITDVADLSGDHTECFRVWDSCLNSDHSHLPSGSVRASTRSRYRQWLTHKLASWIDQFGTSGCVGCGRCITWCPAAIDITAEAAALRAPPPAAAAVGEE
ncbi:MAG TPA: 4Fe-4S dicluster domain-containing protein [Streptosporangiaceae bacterium]